MVNLIDFLGMLLNSQQFLLTVTIASILFKTFILATLIKRGVSTPGTQRPWFLLSLVLIATMIIDSAWIFKILQNLFLPNVDHRIWVFWLRLAWAFTIVQYHSLSLFIESLVSKSHTLNLRQKLFLFISSIFFFFFVGLAIVNFNCLDPESRPAIEFTMQKILSLYALFPLILSGIFFAIQKAKVSNLPHILKKQLRILLQTIVAPYWLSDFLQVYPFDFSPTWITNSYFFTSFSTILLTSAVYYCTRKVVGLRFLNFQNHVQSPIMQFNFMDKFKHILEQLSYVSSMQELKHITQGFFKETFSIPLNKTMLYIRTLPHAEQTAHEYDRLNTGRSLVETFMSTQDKTIIDFIKQHKILIHDEIAFNNFYEETPITKALLHFLETINADIFIPIYERDELIAYILVDRHARFNEFYSDVERDEMLVFASYLGKIINLLQNKNLDTIIAKQKDLTEELYRKHQEINQYKESIRSFIRTNQHKDIGIIFYKNRQFHFGNHTAKEMIPLNINMQVGHPLAKELKHIAQKVENYKSPHNSFAKDLQGNTIVLSAVPHLENNHVIIMIHYPDVSDVLKKQIDLLQDPSEWDYLLYLETTESGKLINQLIPGSGEVLLSFKIELLKTALSKKATLLDLPEEDLLPMVELLHHISLRKTLHTINIQGAIKNYDVAITLFGMNPIFGKPNADRPLLEKLDGIGTLFIKNIHLLNLETQEYLAEFLKYGFYRMFKGNQKIPSNVRIICSTNQNLQYLVQEGKFSQALFNELKQTTLTMPSLLTLSDQELANLADGFTEQAVKTQTFKNLLMLTDKDKTKLANKRPASLQELKNKIQQILVNKSKENEIYQETQFDPAYQISDPELVQAARLGKKALKDQRIMTMLWDKFKNQNKIATFLGVNRSSVNRRCKEFNLD